ncbi:MAG: PEGA domain-containing protein [Candidatus Saccharimonadales bacterium]
MNNHTGHLVKKLVILAVIVTIGMVVVVIVQNRFNMGTIDIKVEPGDASVRLDGKIVAPGPHQVKPGKHVVAVSKSGYLDAEKEFETQKGKTRTAYVFLDKANVDNYTKQAIADSGIYKDTSITNQFNILKIKEFYGGTWVIATVQLRGSTDKAIIVVKQDAITKKYELFINPSPQPDPSLVTQLPADLQASLKQDAWLEVEASDLGHDHGETE